MASIDDATPDEWDAIKAERYHDNRPYDIKDATCTLVKPMPEVPEGNFKWDRYAPSPDPVDNPPHYKVGEMQAIDYIYQQLGAEGIKTYLEGNILKYMHRWRYKNGVEDLRKARWYLDKLIFEEVQGG